MGRLTHALVSEATIAAMPATWGFTAWMAARFAATATALAQAEIDQMKAKLRQLNR